MSRLLSGLGAISAIALVVTLVIAVFVKLIMYLIGKQITTPNKRTRKLLFFEFAIMACSFAILFGGALIEF